MRAAAVSHKACDARGAKQRACAQGQARHIAPHDAACALRTRPACGAPSPACRCARATQALANQPPGTFICRFSMSQPGALVLSCKMLPDSCACADQDGLVHAIIQVPIAPRACARGTRPPPACRARPHAAPLPASRGRATLPRVRARTVPCCAVLAWHLKRGPRTAAPLRR